MKGESLALCLHPLIVLGNNLVTKFCLQCVGVDLCAARAISKENRGLVLPELLVLCSVTLRGLSTNEIILRRMKKDRMGNKELIGERFLIYLKAICSHWTEGTEENKKTSMGS